MKLFLSVLSLFLVVYGAKAQHMDVTGAADFLGRTPAYFGEERYLLTPPTAGQRGGIWHPEAFLATQGFEISFDLHFTEAGGDGVVLAWRPASDSALGGRYGWEGLNGWALVFDVYQPEDAGDAPFDYVQLVAGSDAGVVPLSAPVPLRPDSATVADGLDHRVEVVWDPTVQEWRVWFDEVARLVVSPPTPPADSLLWGFTGGTEATFAAQVVGIESFAIFTPDLALSLGEETERVGLYAVPNPALAGRVTLRWDQTPTSVAIYDLGGRLVRSLRPRPTEQTVEVSGLSAGVYLLRADAQPPLRLVVR